MFETMRKVFGPAAVTIIIGAIALVFVFYGVYNPRTTKGLGAGALAATVNGEGITVQEFSREYSQRIQQYAGMMQGKLDPKLLAQLGIRERILEDLIQRKLLLQETHRMGIHVSDAEVRDKIQEMPYFQKEGRFDAAQYKAVLSANKYAPSTFEQMVRDDLLRDQLLGLMGGRVQVADQEVQDEFIRTNDQRQVDFVVVSRKAAMEQITISDKELSSFLGGEGGKLAQGYYDRNKYEFAKPMPKENPSKSKKTAVTKPQEPEYTPFGEVQRKIALKLLRERQAEVIQKNLHRMADALLAKAKGSSTEFRSEAKKLGLEVKTSIKFNRDQTMLPEIGDATALQRDAFDANSPLFKEPRQYESQGNLVVVMGLKTFAPDLAQLDKSKEQMLQQVRSKKRQEFFENWMSQMRTRSKVAVNEDLKKQEDVAE